MLKIKPLEEWIGDAKTYSYVGIRADENRGGYVSTKTNISPVFPFKEDGIDKAKVLQLLDDAGVGLPSYYEWRTRSGCSFCFFQRFEEAIAYEEKQGFEGTASQARHYTWTNGESLRQLRDRSQEIKDKHEAAMTRAAAKRVNLPLVDVLGGVLDDEDDEAGCTVCHV